MERIEVTDDGRIAAWIEAAERGEQIIFTRDGRVVAEMKSKARPVFNLEKLKAFHAKLGPLAGTDGTKLVRDMRDMDDH